MLKERVGGTRTNTLRRVSDRYAHGMTAVLILPSPLLPGMVYRPLVEALTAARVRAELATVPKDPSAPALVEQWRAKAAGFDVLAPHSNAGLLAPLVAGEGQRIVFMDASLPPTSGTFPMANGRLTEMLHGLTDKRGRLEPWTRWWPRSAFDEIIPEKLFRKVDRACPQLPADYFAARLTVPEGWVDNPHSYLAFGMAYGEEFEAAREWGWARKAMQGAHLHFLVRPDDVAREIVALAG